MTMSDSTSATDMLTALASAGIGSVGVKGNTIEHLPRDHGTDNSSVPPLQVACSDTANGDVDRSELAQRRDEREEVESSAHKFRIQTSFGEDLSRKGY